MIAILSPVLSEQAVYTACSDFLQIAGRSRRRRPSCKRTARPSRRSAACFLRSFFRPSACRRLLRGRRGQLRHRQIPGLPALRVCFSLPDTAAPGREVPLFAGMAKRGTSADVKNRYVCTGLRLFTHKLSFTYSILISFFGGSYT